MAEENVGKTLLSRLQWIFTDPSRNALDVVAQALALVVAEYGFDHAAFCQVRDKSLQVISSKSHLAALAPGSIHELKTTLAQWTYGADDLVVWPNVTTLEQAEHPAFALWPIRYYIGVPVLAEAQPWGVVFVANNVPRPEVPQDQQEIMKLLGRWCNTLLSHKLREHQLRQAKESAEAAASAKEDFLSTMSHEIRTPMNAIIGLTHWLMQENPREDQLDSLRLLKFSGENLLVLINDILDFAKIEAGKVNLEAIDFDFKELLHSLTHALGFRAEEKGIKLMVDLAEGTPTVFKGDVVRLGQVLNNLVSNAIKFTHKGSVKIEVRYKGELQQKALLHVAVHDTGIGIPKHKQEAIFESFTQASDDTTRKYGGTGLGLSITRRLLELMGSAIQLESVPGKGSIFYFELALPQGDPDALKEDQQHRQQLFERLDKYRVHVLVADDNKANQLVAGKFMETWGVKVSYANNGQEALDMVQEDTFDLVLMDLQMPTMDGFKASTAIRALPGEASKIPIIALSAAAQDDTQDKAMAAGMNDIVGKPFNPQDLYRKVVANIARLQQADVAGQDERHAWMEEVESALRHYSAQEEESFLPAMLHHYKTQLARLEEEASVALLSQNLKQYRQVCDSMALSLESLPLDPLTQVLKQGEEALATKASMSGIHYVVDQLEEQVEVVNRVIRNMQQ